MAGLKSLPMPFMGRLGAKILLVMASALIVTSLLFLTLIVPRFYNDLLNERTAGSTQLGNLMEVSLEHLMLVRDINSLRTLLSQMGSEPDIKRVMILDDKGQIRFSSDIALVGSTLASTGAACPDCLMPTPDGANRSQTFTDGDGNHILRTVNVIYNQDRCTRCHQPVAEHPINGYLTIDLSTTHLERKAVWSAVFLAIAGCISLLFALGATWFAIRKLILKPVNVLTEASKALADGDLSARTGIVLEPGRRDEIHTLSASFDRMAERLDETVSRLREQRSFQQALIDAIPDGIRVINEEFSVEVANKEFCRQTGMTHSEIMASPCYVSSHNRKERCVPTMTVCPLAVWQGHNVTDGFIKYMHIHTNHRNGNSFPVEVVTSRLEVMSAGKPRRLVVEAIRDVSKQVEISQEQRLSEIGHLATGVAHEIRNPLASISLGIKAIKQSLTDQGDFGEVRDYMKAVEENIEECIVVTDRLLHLSRLPTEKGELLDIRTIINDTVGILRYEAEICNVEVRVDVPENLRIVGCDGSIRMVAFNIIQNAFHAMPKGGKLTVAARERTDKHIEISIADTGIGISLEHLPLIFYPFWSWRADKSRGSGLGLAICKSTVERWFGTITVASTPGEGATFFLDFPPADEVIERI